MLFDATKKNGHLNPFITVKEALKKGSEKFGTEVEAILYVQNSGIKAVLVDGSGTPYYKSTDLGVDFNENPEDKKEKKS